ncbi:MAG: O-acetylhomoserine aminocarboxypropyltransferase [Methylocystaceae bacterium]|nr:O-acetylhomoserine aminocarboxypropyltransferase [Methylocystaceae bacterium]
MNDYPKEYGIETRAIHAGARPDAVTGARNTPIYQTTSYVFEDVEHAADLFNLQTFGFIYSRLTNPTVAVLEERIANLEGGRAGVCCASGHSAQFLAFFSLLEPGDRFLASKNLYGGSITQFGVSFKRLGWDVDFVDATDLQAVKAAIKPEHKALFIEPLANPGGIILDTQALADLAHENNMPLVVDNTMATPILFRPFEHGADIITHSATKFLSGHGTSMGGAIVESGKFDWAKAGKFPALTEPDPAYHGMSFYETFGDFGFSMKTRCVGLRDFGPAMSPTNAFNIITGIETLHLRMERHVENAQKISAFLEGHPKVSWVSYAGLKSNRYYDLAQKYMPKGAGSVFTFGVKGGFEAGVKVVESVNLISHLANIGDTRSLIIHPASTTHRQLSEEQQIAAGAGPDVLRLSVGLESANDIIRDLDEALA